uniref:Cell number regulator 6 n=1 Tax=Leersia perrieri TaxID=77586 RepID=A0A0D9VN92_9ORYZ
MAEEATLSHPSRYVKLTRDQDAPAEDIRPGELNQPVHLEGRRCTECGQVLPETYEPPADEPWTTGIFACTDDPDSCRTGLFCPCVLFGRNIEALREDIPWTTPCVCHAVFVEGGIALAILTAIFHGVDPRTSFLIGEGLVFSWWLCGTYTGIFRQELQRKYHLKNSPCDPCMVHCCLHWCANCQEHRERTGRLAENNAVPMTVVNPPAVQEMSMLPESRGPVSSGMENGASSSSKAEHEAAKSSDHDDVEVIPL